MVPLSHAKWTGCSGMGRKWLKHVQPANHCILTLRMKISEGLEVYLEARLEHDPKNLTGLHYSTNDHPTCNPTH